LQIKIRPRILIRKNILLLFYFSQFIFFFLHAYAKGMLMRVLPASTKSSSPWLSLLSSCLAGVGNVLLTNPLWVTNMAIVSGTTETQNLFSELLRLWKERGPRRLWTGTDASLLLVSNPIIQFVCYDQFKRIRLASKAGQRQSTSSTTRRPTNKASVPGTLGPAEAFVCAALAKAIATVSTYPLQLTQTLLRLSSNNNRSISNDNKDVNCDSEEANVPERQQYQGTMDCLVQLYRKNDSGCAAWFTGMKAKLLQTCLTAAFTFLTYEQIVGVVKHVALHTMRMRQNRIRGGRRKEV
jgi:adenine nucleotide transporter 17